MEKLRLNRGNAGHNEERRHSEKLVEKGGSEAIFWIEFGIF